MNLSGMLIEKGRQLFRGGMRYHSGHEIIRIWIVVADQEKAHIYRKIISDGVELLGTAVATGEEKHIPSRSNPYERMQELLHSSHPSLGYDHGSGRKGELKFVQKLAEWLDAAAEEDAFNRLVLIAAPRTLGELRPCLSEKVHDRILTELNKDLAGLPDHKIRAHLAKIAWF